MPTPVTKTVLAATGGVAAAVASTLCCAGPLVAVALGFGFVVLRREEKQACEPGTLCASPVARRRMKWALWIATIVSIPLLTFSWWSKFILG